MSLLNGVRGYQSGDDFITTDASNKPLFTYQTIETPMNTINSKDNIELLKKNGDLIGKYYKQVTDLVAKAKAEDLDISNDLLDLLNNFAYDRDKLFVDIPMVSIPSVWTTEDLDKAKDTETTITSTDDNIAKAYYKIANAKRPKEPPMEYKKSTLFGERNLASEEQKKYNDAVSKVYQPTGANLFEQKLNNDVDKSIDDADRQLNTIKEAVKNGKFKESDDNEFDRSLSLTYGETRKGDKWFSQHQKKYHKDYLKKIKKNPFYGGVSPVAHCYWRWMSCSIGTSCDIICEECEQKYNEAKKAYELLQDNYDVFVHDHKDDKDKDAYNTEVSNQKKKITKAKKEADKWYKQSRLELRGIDE